VIQSDIDERSAKASVRVIVSASKLHTTRYRIAVLACVAVYAALLLPTLARYGIGWDEQTDLGVARTYLSQPGGWLRGSDVDPINVRLPMAVGAVLFAVLGGPDLLAARAISALLGALTLIAVYLFGRRELDARKGILACALLATSPYFLGYARTAFSEGDIFVTCAFAWLLVCLARLRHARTLGWATATGVVLGAALASFFFDLLPVDVTALCLLLALLASGLVTSEEAFAGFSNTSVLTIGGLFILGHALVRTGLLERGGAKLSQGLGHRRFLAVGVLLLLVALGSAFLNNTAVVAITIPLAVDLCRRQGWSPSQVLIPLSFAAIFGGTLTLIGTSTNLLVSGVLEEQGVRPLGMFEMTPLGVVFLVFGLTYVLLAAPRLLPDHGSAESLTGEFDMGAYLTELRVPAGSKLVGRTVHEVRMSERYDVTMLALLRGAGRFTGGFRHLPFEPGDELVVRGATADLLRLRNETGVALLSDAKLSDEELVDEGRRAVVEAVVGPDSGLVGRTLHGVDFRRTLGAFVLAIRRNESTLRQRLAHTPLRFGDTLLIVADRDRLPELRRRGDLLLTTELPDVDVAHRGRLWWLPAALIPLAMLLAALGVVDLLTGVLASIVLLLALRLIRPQESYDAVDWRVVVFIAAFIPVGDAMVRTGLADLVGRAALAPVAWAPDLWAPWIAVSVLYLVTSLATEAVSNNAAAVILTPVALSMAAVLEVEPRALIFAVCFAASASFMTPTGYQTNMMVYGAGNYRFADFTRIGLPLNVLFWLVASVLLPVLFPFG